MDEIPSDIPEEDVIDQAIFDLIDSLLGQEADDDSFDEAANVVFEVIEDMVNRGEIKEMPENDATDDVKKKWVEDSLGPIKEVLSEYLHDGFQET